MRTPPSVDEVIRVAVYNRTVGVLHRYADFLSWCTTMDPNFEDDGRRALAAVHSFADPHGRLWHVAWLPKGSAPTTIAHEAVHMSWFLLDAVGVEVDVDNHEAQAYLVDYLFGEFMRVCKRTRRKKDA